MPFAFDVNEVREALREMTSYGLHSRSQFICFDGFETDGGRYAHARNIALLAALYAELVKPANQGVSLRPTP